MNTSTDPQESNQAASQAYQALLNQARSLVLATTNPDGSPLASYTPFIANEQRQFYIFTSQLAAHTRNLERTGQASVMLIEDEAEAAQIFARQRVTFQCQAELVARDSQDGEKVLGQYEARFGKMVGLLRSLPDFQLFKLQPLSGSLVLGFGQAYELDGDRFESLGRLQSG
jgi:putative heme iron utilization protein